MQPSSTNYQAAKRERFEFRIPKELKLLLQRAADIQGKTLSDFLTTTAEKAATQIIEENQIIRLSVEDSLAFAEAIVASSKPNKHLKSAYSEYHQNVSSD